MMKPLSPAQQRMLDMFDSEPMTPTNIGTALNLTVETVRLHLKTLISKGYIETTRRGRVVYYHKKGVDVPTGEEISPEEFASGDADSHGDDEDHGVSDVNEDDDDESISEILMGHVRRRKIPRNDDWVVDGAVDLKRVVSTYDPDTANNEELAKLRKDTPSSALPLVSEALTCMISLQGDQPGLRDLYAKYEAHDIERGLLIRWFLAMKAHGVDPSLIVQMKAKNVIKDDFHERAIMKEEEDALFHRSLSVEEWKLKRH